MQFTAAPKSLVLITGAVLALTGLAACGSTPTAARPAAPPTAAVAPPASPPASAAAPGPAVAGTVFYQDSTGALRVGDKKYPGGSVLNLNVSPDGKQVSGVDDNGASFVADLDGANRRVLFPNVDGMCVEPVWAGDSTRLLVHEAAGAQRVLLLAVHGTGDELGTSIGCHYRLSADGKHMAVLNGDLSGITLTNNLGAGRRVIVDRAALGGRVLTDLATISADGGRVCVRVFPAGSPGGDAARNLNCNAIFDTATNKEVALPVAGELRAALFQPDGGMLLRVRTGAESALVRVDPSGAVVARTVETAEQAEFALLGYTA